MRPISLSFSLSLLLSVSLPLPLSFSDAQRPNVLFIAVDDMRMNIGCYGDPIAVTPNIDRLAARSIRFDRAYCQFASCNASRSSLITGMRPDSISVWKLNTNFRDTTPDAITLPQAFKQNGYHTESIGKVLHNYYDTLRDNERSWSAPARFDKVNHFRDYGYEKNLPTPGKLKKTIVAENADIPDEAYADGIIADDAVATIRRLAAKDTPFFLAIGFLKPHSPYNAPKKYWDLYERADMNALGSTKAPSGVPEQNWWDSSEIRTFADIPKKGPIPEETASRMRHGYYAATSYADANIGKALDALEESGAADNTIIVLWSDHGYHLGENSQWAKVTVRELDARVPLIISIPGGQSDSTKALVESIDLYPTLSELCGLPASEAIDGRSFKSVLSNSNSSFRSTALTQVCRPWSNKAPIEQMAYSIRTDQHRYTQWLDFETNELIAEELYAIENDLLQRDNLATSSPERLSNFRSLINQTLNSPTNPSP